MIEERKKSGLFDTFINWLCIVILLGLLVREFSHLYRTPDSIENHAGLYERHYIVSGSFPYVGSYFLMRPAQFDPKKLYPMTVVLQGRSPHIYAADYLATDEFRKRYNGFVLVPIAPVRSLWATPVNKDYSMAGWISFPDAMPQVIDEIEEIRAANKIDPRRVYLTGHSMGGMGVIGALEYYPQVFAAATVLSGVWDPKDTGAISAPVWIFHGSADGQIPAKMGKAVATALNEQGKPVLYDELKGLGHDTWKVIYPSQKVWDWLYSQHRS